MRQGLTLPLAGAFRPSPEFARLLRADAVALPRSAADAAARVRAAGWQVTAAEVSAGDRPAALVVARRDC